MCVRWLMAVKLVYNVTTDIWDASAGGEEGEEKKKKKECITLTNSEIDVSKCRIAQAAVVRLLYGTRARVRATDAYRLVGYVPTDQCIYNLKRVSSIDTYEDGRIGWKPVIPGVYDLPSFLHHLKTISPRGISSKIDIGFTKEWLSGAVDAGTIIKIGDIWFSGHGRSSSSSSSSTGDAANEHVKKLWHSVTMPDDTLMLSALRDKHGFEKYPTEAKRPMAFIRPVEPKKRATGRPRRKKHKGGGGGGGKEEKQMFTHQDVPLLYPDRATVGNGVRVSTSSIAGAGNGLYATRVFSVGALITPFHGDIIDYKDAMEKRKNGKSGYIAPLMNQLLCVETDGIIRDGRGGAQFANHKAKKPNSKLLMMNDKSKLLQWPFLVACAPIDIGDEIFFNYGKGAFNTDHSVSFCRGWGERGGGGKEV